MLLLKSYSSQNCNNYHAQHCYRPHHYKSTTTIITKPFPINTTAIITIPVITRTTITITPIIFITTTTMNTSIIITSTMEIFFFWTLSSPSNLRVIILLPTTDTSTTAKTTRLISGRYSQADSWQSRGRPVAWRSESCPLPGSHLAWSPAPPGPHQATEDTEQIDWLIDLISRHFFVRKMRWRMIVGREARGERWSPVWSWGGRGAGKTELSSLRLTEARRKKKNVYWGCGVAGTLINKIITAHDGVDMRHGRGSKYFSAVLTVRGRRSLGGVSTSNENETFWCGNLSGKSGCKGMCAFDIAYDCLVIRCWLTLNALAEQSLQKYFTF